MWRVRRGRPSMETVLWLLVWLVVGSAVIASNVGSELAVDSGTVRIEQGDRLEVDAHYSRDVSEQDVVPPVGVPRVSYAYIAFREDAEATI